MDLVTVIFWIIAVILVGAALFVVTQRNIVHSALALVIVFAMAAGIYLLNKQWWLAVIVSTFVGAIIVYAAAASPHAVSNFSDGSGQLPAGISNVVRIGQLLYSPTTYSYVLPFEIASLVLLVAIVGAIVIGRED